MKLIQTLNTSSQAVAAGGVFNIGAVDRKVPAVGTFFVDGTTIKISQPGFYEVTVTVNGTSAAGTAIVKLQSNETDIVGAFAQDTIGTASDPFSLSFTKIIKVFPSCRFDNITSLRVVNGSTVAVTSTDLVISIVKVD